MNDFYIINNDDKLRKLYLKLKVLLIIKNKKNYIENVNENKEKKDNNKKLIVLNGKENMNKNEEKKDNNKELIVLNGEENVNVIKENLNGTIEIDIIVNDNEEIKESEEEILKKKLNKGKEDLDVGCIMCCRGCRNILEYISFHVRKRCVYMREKIIELINKKED